MIMTIPVASESNYLVSLFFFIQDGSQSRIGGEVDMDYTYVSDSVLIKMKNQEQNQESSPSKTFFSSLVHFL